MRCDCRLGHLYPPPLFSDCRGRAEPESLHPERDRIGTGGRRAAAAAAAASRSRGGAQADKAVDPREGVDREVDGVEPHEGVGVLQAARERLAREERRGWERAAKRPPRRLLPCEKPLALRLVILRLSALLAGRRDGLSGALYDPK